MRWSVSVAIYKPAFHSERFDFAEQRFYERVLFIDSLAKYATDSFRMSRLGHVTKFCLELFDSILLNA